MESSFTGVLEIFGLILTAVKRKFERIRRSRLLVSGSPETSHWVNRNIHNAWDSLRLPSSPSSQFYFVFEPAILIWFLALADLSLGREDGVLWLSFVSLYLCVFLCIYLWLCWCISAILYFLTHWSDRKLSDWLEALHRLFGWTWALQRARSQDRLLDDISIPCPNSKANLAKRLNSLRLAEATTHVLIIT